MVRSMTGFGRGEKGGAHLAITVEAKAVNHRYLDLAIRLPRELNLLEEQLRSVFRQQIARGRVDIFVKLVTRESESRSVTINTSLAEIYVEQARSLSARTGLAWDLTVASLLRLPEVVEVAEADFDADEAAELLAGAAEQAVAGMVAMRAVEGERLAADILTHLNNIEQQLSIVEQRSPAVVLEYKARLENRLQELLPEGLLDAGRLAQEVAMFADRACIAEETVRLRSHLEQARVLLDQRDAVGRKLDFLVQEMNREINTIGSKANDAEIAKLVVDLKSDLEKIREQVQNIE